MPSTFVSGAAYALAVIPLFATPTYAAALNAMTYLGCYSSSQPLTDQGSYTYQTSGYCQPLCAGKGQPVLALSGGTDCWCGNLIPSGNSKVDDSKCSVPCNGYNQENCGGDGFYSVYLTGTSSNVGTFGGSSSSSSSDSSAPATTDGPSSSSQNSEPSVITSVAPGTTIIVTQTPGTTGASRSGGTTSSGSKPNVAGIAAGVVVGVVAIGAIGIGAFLLLRRRKRRQVEEEHKRAAAASAFINRGGEGKPPSSGYSNMSDQRLDAEAAAGRRNSVGSIADNQDFSRKILRVANPDSRD